MAIFSRISNLAKGLVLVARDGGEDTADAALEAELAAARPRVATPTRAAPRPAEPEAEADRPSAPELDEHGEVKRTL